MIKVVGTTSWSKETQDHEHTGICEDLNLVSAQDKNTHLLLLVSSIGQNGDRRRNLGNNSIC